MPTPSFEPGRPGGQYPPPGGDASREDPGVPGKISLPDRNLLQGILDRALSCLEPTDREVRSDLGVLSKVAARHPGKPFTLDPIAIDLVEAMLDSSFSSLGCRPGAWRSVSEAVARTLCDDPTAQERLQALWLRLTEASR